MRLTSYLQNRELTIALLGEIDHHCAKEYIDQIKSKLETYGPAVCILDYQDVTFMDSSGIAVVINAIRFMKRIGGELRIINLNNQPMKILKTAGIERLIDLEDKNEV